MYMVDLFSYLEETNWKKRFDSSLVNGRGESYRLKDRRKNALPTERRGEKNE